MKKAALPGNEPAGLLWLSENPLGFPAKELQSAARIILALSTEIPHWQPERYFLSRTGCEPGPPPGGRPPHHLTQLRQLIVFAGRAAAGLLQIGGHQTVGLQLAQQGVHRAVRDVNALGEIVGYLVAVAVLPALGTLRYSELRREMGNVDAGAATNIALDAALDQAPKAIFLTIWRKIILPIPLIFLLPRLWPNAVAGVYLAEPIADTVAVCTTAPMFYTYYRKLK